MVPTLLPVKWEEGFYPEAERLVREATHFIWWQVKNEYSYIRPFTPPLCLHVFIEINLLYFYLLFITVVR
jgi:hypothetical protein